MTTSTRNWRTYQLTLLKYKILWCTDSFRLRFECLPSLQEQSGTSFPVQESPRRIHRLWTRGAQAPAASRMAFATWRTRVLLEHMGGWSFCRRLPGAVRPWSQHLNQTWCCFWVFRITPSEKTNWFPCNTCAQASCKRIFRLSDSRI